jgi:exodeoxyribonuclease-3
VIIATWNVNSVLARLPLVLRWLEEARPDVLCLQELKCVDERFPAAEFEAAGYLAAVNGQPTYNGVAILSRHPLEDVRRGMTGDEEGAHARVIAARTGGINVVNVYVPNGQSVGTDKYKFKLEWLARLRAHLDEEFWADDDVLLCGDFNVAPEDRDVHDPELWRGRILFSQPERAAIEEVKAWGFTDAFRLHNPGGGQFSWWDYRQGGFRRNLGLRIDHVWVSEPLAERCKRSWIDKEPRGWERPSDHTPVVAEFTKA